MYNFSARQLVASNTCFNIYFDHLQAKNESIPDYLVISPKRRVNGNIVGVLVLPLYNKKFVLMSVWRHHLSDFVWQAPAGFINDGESIESAAIRELQEETFFNCDISDLHFLGYFFPDAALVDGKVAVFFASNCFDSNLLPVEEIGTGTFSYFDRSECLDLLQRGNVSGSTAYSIYSALSLFSDLV